MPLWDALNHITGRCNVRLHHDEKGECLQMIATGQTLCPNRRVMCQDALG